MGRDRGSGGRAGLGALHRALRPLLPCVRPPQPAANCRQPALPPTLAQRLDLRKLVGLWKPSSAQWLRGLAEALEAKGRPRGCLLWDDELMAAS